MPKRNETPRAGGRLLRATMAGVLALSLMGTPAFAANTGSDAPATYAAEGTVHAVAAASDLPDSISAGETYQLTADIALADGQQLSEVAGVLDGCGHTITLAGKPLAQSVSGTVQNLGVTSSGVIESSDNLGSIAVTLSGTVRMCWSTASLKLSGWMGEVGGLVGELAGGTVSNCYFAGSIDSMMSGGLVGTGSTGAVRNCLFTAGDSAVSMGYGSLVNENCREVSVADLSSASSLEVLSVDAPDAGYVWASNGAFPQLREASAPVVVDKSALDAAVAAAEQLSESDYEADGWQAFAAALSAAKQVIGNEDATQQQVNDAVKALTGAQSALAKKKPTAPTEVPSAAKHIKSQDDFISMNVKDESAYYVLDNDIVIDDEYFFGPSGALACTFDGQGHSVTFANGGGVPSLFDGVAATGVVENVSFAGQLKQATDGRSFGLLGKDVAGAVVNCSTSVSGKGVVGFARTLAGGVVSNCYSTAEASGGALFASYNAGRLVNTYWSSYQAQPAQFPIDALSNSFALDPKDMRSAAFTELLNANRGSNGAVWAQAADGYPYFGADAGYVEPDDVVSDDVYPVTFTANDGTACAIGDNHVLEVSPDDVAADRLIGVLSLSGVPEGSSVTWSTGDANRNNIAVNETTGQLYVYDNAAGTVTATETAVDGTQRTVATIKVQAKAQPIDDFQIWYDGADVTGGSITVAGSEVRNLEVRVHYVGSPEGSYVPASFTRFSFEGSSADVLYSNEYSACFYFKKQGDAMISVTSRNNPDLGAKTVSVTSANVAATGVSLGYAEDGQPIVLQGRNPLSDGVKAFLTDKASPHVTPDNATNRDNFTVTSSNPAVAAYTAAGDIGFTPYAAGTTTFTVTLPDVDAETGKAIRDSREVSYEYANPLVGVTAPDSVTVKAGERAALGLSFAGKNDEQGWSITEPGMTWSYSEDGVISIDRDVAGEWKHAEGAPDDGLYIASSEYAITALRPGTVTVTGTPVDTTAGAKPVTFTVTVDGIAPAPADVAKLVDEGIESAASFLDANRSATAFVYGDEWELYTFVCAGRGVEPAMIERYLASVKANADVWSASLTDTERVMLTMAALGKDVTDVAGKNLVELVRDGSSTAEMSNEIAYALLALDKANAQAPEGGSSDRDALVAKLLTFQNEDGGFGLTAGSGSGVDMTAIALQALAPYADANADAVSAALGFLRTKMSPGTCDFGSAESDAQVLLALTALGKDPLNTVNGFANSVSNLITAIMAYNVEPMGFAHVKGQEASAMPSVQVLQALSSYKQHDWKSDVKPGNNVSGRDPQLPLAPVGDGNGNKGSLVATGDSALAANVLLCVAGLAVAAAAGAARRMRTRR